MGLKLNPFTGKFDIVNDNNFSFNNIPAQSYLRIPTNQQMLVYKELVNSGDIQNDGDIVIFETTPKTRPINTITEDITLNAEYFNVLVDCTDGDIDLTLPGGASYANKEFNIKRIDNSGNRLFIIGTVDGGTGTELASQYESITVQYNGSSWWIL